MRVAWVCAAAVAAALDPNVLEAFRSGDADHDARLDPDEFEAALASLYVARARTGAIAPLCTSGWLSRQKVTALDGARGQACQGY